MSSSAFVGILIIAMMWSLLIHKEQDMEIKSLKQKIELIEKGNS